MNTTRRLRAAWLGVALAASAAVALPEIPGGTAHWKSIVEIEGGTREGMGPIDSEIWLKAGRMRMQMRVLGMTQNVIRIGDTTYQWIEGQKSGVKLAGNPEDRASGIYANRIDEYRTKGKKTGSETIDGHACDIYELTTTAKDGRVRKETLWLAGDLRSFPLKVIEESGGSKVTSRNSEVALGKDFGDAIVTVPADVEFRDMAEVLKNMQPPKQ